MTAARRLGYFVPQFPGQTHIFFWREIKALQALGVEPVLLSTLPPPPTLISHEWSEEAISRTTYLGRGGSLAGIGALARSPVLEVVKAARLEPATFLRDVALALPMAARLVSVANRERLKHVHVHSFGRAALIAALAKMMGGPSYSATLHGPISDYGSGQRIKWRHAAFATVITKQLLDEVQALSIALPSRIVVQPMGVDVDFLRRSESWSAPRADEPLRLFTCARLNPVKGHLETIAAVKMLVDHGRSVRLAIAGEDDAGGTGFRKVLEARIKELGVGHVVTLLGAVDGIEVKRRLLDAHLFVLASYHEPLGVALMEAMSCEVPVVSTAAGGVAELVTNGKDGILVGIKDPVALFRTIIDLADNPARARAIGRAGRKTVASGFSSKVGAHTISREVDTVMGGQ